jgi:outer membrane lipoprotein-sorting protein
MLFRRVRVLALLSLVCLAPLGLSSCLVKRRLITRLGAKTAAPILLVANRAELLQKIVEQFNAIDNFNATVDMTPALGTTEKSRVTEYKDVRGYILFRKPSDIRIIGLYPVVRNTAFDMVSNGSDFKLYVPVKNRFLVGRNEVQRPSENKLENLRPQHFLEALLVRPIGPNDRVLMENFTDEDNAFYVLHFVQEAGPQELVLVRTVWFNRVDLRLARQIILDPMGNILTDARYSDWKEYDNIPFPKHIEINRPRDEYAVVLDIVKMDINKGVSDDKFVLNQPEGSTLQTVGQPPVPASQDSLAPPPKGSNR